MDRSTRYAFIEDEEHNPPGQNPSTGHWSYVRCAKYLHEWADWIDGPPSRDALTGTLVKERECDGFAEHRAGLAPQEHPSFGQPGIPGIPEALEYDVFLSHSSEDDELAQRVRTLLEASEIRTFATPGSIPSGLWNPQIEGALQRSQHLWLLLTPAALDRSIWAHQEFGYFYGYKRALDPENADQRLHYTCGQIRAVVLPKADDSPKLKAKMLYAASAQSACWDECGGCRLVGVYSPP
jgi:hypothetical protein